MRDNSKTHREKQRHREEARPANDVLPNGCGRTSFEFEKTSFRAENQSVEGGRKCDRSCGETPKSQQSKVCMTVAAILSDDGPKSAKSYLRKKKKHRKQYDALRTDTIGGFDSFFFFCPLPVRDRQIIEEIDTPFICICRFSVAWNNQMATMWMSGWLGIDLE